MRFSSSSMANNGFRKGCEVVYIVVERLQKKKKKVRFLITFYPTNVMQNKCSENFQGVTMLGILNLVYSSSLMSASK